MKRWGADVVEEEIPFRHAGVRSCQLGFRLVDVVPLRDAFEQRGCLMQNVPRLLIKPFWLKPFWLKHSVLKCARFSVVFSFASLSDDVSCLAKDGLPSRLPQDGTK